jgi:hypothetical protein
LESKSTDHDAEYEALIQGLKKAINLKVKSIEVIGDFRLGIKQVRNSMFSTFHHLNNYQREVWSFINKFDSFNIKSIPYIEKYDTNMLIIDASKLNIYDGSIDMKFSDEPCRPLIPNTNWRILNYHQHVIEHLKLREASKGSIINEEQHEVFHQALVSDKNHELQDLLENHFGL